MEVKELNGMKVVGIKVTATFEDLHSQVPEAWKRLMTKADYIPHRKNKVFMDITLMKEGDQYTQLVGAEVNELPEEQDDELEFVTIPAQSYLHYRHEGPEKEIARSYGKMYDYARDERLKADEFKIDCGYTADGAQHPHDLYVRIETTK